MSSTGNIIKCLGVANKVCQCFCYLNHLQIGQLAKQERFVNFSIRVWRNLCVYTSICLIYGAILWSAMKKIAGKCLCSSAEGFSVFFFKIFRDSCLRHNTWIDTMWRNEIKHLIMNCTLNYESKHEFLCIIESKWLHAIFFRILSNYRAFMSPHISRRLPWTLDVILSDRKRK